jgi:hypothetical protein
MCHIEIYNHSVQRNEPEVGLIRLKYVVQQDYICLKEGVLMVTFHT